MILFHSIINNKSNLAQSFFKPDTVETATKFSERFTFELCGNYRQLFRHRRSTDAGGLYCHASDFRDVEWPLCRVGRQPLVCVGNC